MSEIYDVCHICGLEKKMTFEHIPPHKALNDIPARVFTGVELLKKYNGEKVKYVNMQRGRGGYTLCEECNNKTGSWYASEYTGIALAIYSAIREYEPMQSGTAIHFHTDKFRPLSFIKQVITMFCSTIHVEEVRRLGFDKLLLDKKSNLANKSLFDIRVYLTNTKNGSFQTGPIILLKECDGTYYHEKRAEIGAYPFGFILNLTPEHICDDGVSIMWMLDTEYGIDYEVEFEIPFLEKRI